MMPEWHQLDSSSTMSKQQESAKKKNFKIKFQVILVFYQTINSGWFYLSMLRRNFMLVFCQNNTLYDILWRTMSLIVTYSLEFIDCNMVALWPYIYMSWFTSELRVKFESINMFKLYVSRLSLLYCLVCSLQPCDHLLGKSCPLGPLVCDVSFCFCRFSIWCSGKMWYSFVSISDICLLLYNLFWKYSFTTNLPNAYSLLAASKLQTFFIYSKPCVKGPLSKGQKIGFQYQVSLNAGQKYCKGSILQCFRPALSYHLSLRSLFCLFSSGRFTTVLLYSKASNKFSICWRMNIYINATGDFLRHENVSREASDFM